MDTYEEKYKEALKVIESLYNVVKYQSNSDAILTCQTLKKAFPELKESEDERIRKALIKGVESVCKEDEIFIGDFTRKQIVDWLEKQGEKNQKHFELKAGHWYICHSAFCCRADHLTVKEGERFMCEKDGVAKGFVIKEPEKYFREVCAPTPIEDKQEPIDKVEPKFKVGDKIIHKELGGDFIHNPHKIIQVDMLDKKYRLEDGLVAHFSEEDDWELVEQKPAWSEEDERERKRVVGLLEGWLSTFKETCYAKDCKRGIAWLKSLKDRAQPQPKQEWSEADEEKFRDVIRLVEQGAPVQSIRDHYINWLKSIKPQNRWKPSEEQMIAMDWEIKNTNEGSWQRIQMELLYNDLEKL